MWGWVRSPRLLGEVSTRPLRVVPSPTSGEYLIKPTAEVDSGYEMINADPNMLRQVHQKYLKAGQLPPALQPKYIRKPEVMEQGVTGRAKNISRGWRNPRSRQG